MYAIVNIAGKQYRLSEGDQIRVNSLKTEVGKNVSFNSVLMVHSEKETLTGTPTLTGAEVIGKILEHGRERKVLIYKKKRRKGYQRKNGHRQGFTLVQIEKIKLTSSEKKTSATSRKKPVAKKTAAKTEKKDS
ncbi:MAG: 50S ribosomal protein L21 [Fidelibacterota bacterium]